MEGQRQSAVHDDYEFAQTELRRHQVEIAEIKRGIRNAPPPKKTCGDLFDYWLEKRAPRKRSQKDDESIIFAARARPDPCHAGQRTEVLQRVDVRVGLRVDVSGKIGHG
jgi:hypothetical protein